MKNIIFITLSILFLVGCTKEKELSVPKIKTQYKDISVTTPKNENSVMEENNLSIYQQANLEFSKKNYLDAIKLYKQATKQNNSEAIKANIKLGDIYANGTGVDTNLSKALDYYLQADHENDYVVKYKIAKTYDNLASNLFIEKFNQQKDKSLTAFLNFELSKEDKKKEKNLYLQAIRYLKIPLKQKMPEAQSLMGRYYLYGVGVQEDIAKGIMLSEEAAHNGIETAQMRLANLYYDGEKVPKDLTKAVFWFQKLAENGNKEAQFRLGWIYSEIDSVKDLKKGISWYKQACKQKEPASCNNLGHAYEYGLGVEKDINKAIEYYETSAKNGGDFGQMNMGYAYLNGKGKKKNFTEAFYWFKKSANQNNKWAQNELGILLSKGLGTNKDYKEAYKYFTKSADQNVTESKAYLSIMYKHGLGVSKDITKSEQYKKEALHTSSKDSRGDYSMAKLLWNEYVLLGIVKEEEN